MIEILHQTAEATCRNCRGRIVRHQGDMGTEQWTHPPAGEQGRFSVPCPGSPVAEPLLDQAGDATRLTPEEIQRLAPGSTPTCWECRGNGFELEPVTGRAIGRCRVCKGAGLLKAECPRLGQLRCVRKDAHDPAALGGHEYASRGVPDWHDISESDAERNRS